MRQTMKQGIFRRRNFNLLACCVTLCIFAVHAAYAKNTSSLEKRQAADSVEVEIDKISYRGGDTYTIEMALVNKSPKPVLVKEFKKQFSVQTETGFSLLSETSEVSVAQGRHSDLSVTGKKRIVTSVRIPLDTPGIFTTFEGDISLLLRYQFLFADNPEPKHGEHYYWITPRTERWILREGM